MDETIIIKKEAVKLVRKRLKELLKPLGFQPHPKAKNCLIRVREELIDEVSLRTDGSHLEPSFHIYYRKAPFTSVYADLVNGSLWHIMTEQENISAHLRWSAEIPDKGPYYYRTEHFEEVWNVVVLALERYILPYMNSINVEKLLAFMVKYSEQEEDFFQAYQIVFFRDKYFTCMAQAAVYGVGMWIAERYAEGLPYIIFAQNKYREHIRAYEHEKNHFNDERILEVLDTLIDIYERRPEELKDTVQHLVDMISTNWMDYMI